eukprot:750576-Rhodomonas_salina.3
MAGEGWRDGWVERWIVGWMEACGYARLEVTWERGGAGSAAEKIRSGEDATEVARGLWETGRSTVEGAYGEMNREWARGAQYSEGARQSESGVGKQKKRRLLSAEEWYERYNTTGSLDDPPLLDLDDEDFDGMYDKPKVGWGVLNNVKERKFDRVVPDKAADAVENVARKGVKWLNTILTDDPRGAYASPYQRVAPQPQYGSRWDVPDNNAPYQGGYQPSPSPYQSPGPAQYQQGAGYDTGPAYGSQATGSPYVAPDSGFGVAGSAPPAPAAVRRDTFSFDPPPRAQPLGDIGGAPRGPGQGGAGMEGVVGRGGVGDQGFGTGPIASFKFEIFGAAEVSVGWLAVAWLSCRCSRTPPPCSSPELLLGWLSRQACWGPRQQTRQTSLGLGTHIGSAAPLPALCFLVSFSSPALFAFPGLLALSSDPSCKEACGQRFKLFSLWEVGTQGLAALHGRLL